MSHDVDKNVRRAHVSRHKEAFLLTAVETVGSIQFPRPQDGIKPGSGHDDSNNSAFMKSHKTNKQTKTFPLSQRCVLSQI